MGNHKQAKRICPICQLEKTWEVRHETCSRECATELNKQRCAPKAVPVAQVDEFSSLVWDAIRNSKKPVSVSYLSETLDRSEKTVTAAIERLRERGYTVRLSDRGNATVHEPEINHAPITHHINQNWQEWYRFGALGDNHLCNRFARLDVLNALYDLYEKEGITAVYNTGNWLEGEASFVRNDLIEWGLDRQVDYFLKHYPQRKGVKTYYVAGNDHEGWWTKNVGIDIGRHVELRAREMGRDDLVYLGYQEANVELRWKNGLTRTLRVSHPGGGSAYAISYKAQKYVESLQGGQKPHILLQGHYHKFNVGYPREVYTVDTGTTADQTSFMRQKQIQAHVGGLICEVKPNADGTVWRFRSEFIPFYDLSVWTAKGQEAA